MLVEGDVVPSVTATHDLGTSSLKWNNVYLSGSCTCGIYESKPDESYEAIKKVTTENGKDKYSRKHLDYKTFPNWMFIEGKERKNEQGALVKDNFINVEGVISLLIGTTKKLIEKVERLEATLS